MGRDIAPLYPICQDYQKELTQLVQELASEQQHAGSRSMSLERFRSVEKEHLASLREVLRNEATRDLSVDAKLELLRDEFPELPFKRTTLWKIQRYVLGYSYKRVTSYKTRQIDSMRWWTEKMLFMQRYVRAQLDPDTVILVIDECGIGTQPLRRYGYAKVGKSLRRSFHGLGRNLSMVAAMSMVRVESLQVC